MVFSSPLFLFMFLPAVLAAYYGAYCLTRSHHTLNLVLLVGSVVFYFWGAPKSEYAFFFCAGIVLDFWLAILVARYRGSELAQARAILALSIALNLMFLGYYKYANFFSELVGSEGKLFFHWEQVILPIGISFFVFHKISYVVDVYRGRIAPKRNLRDFALYLLFFPQLIAGPIVRYHTIASQIDERRHSADAMFEGIWRFSIGLAKKVLIANQLGAIADEIFAFPGAALTPGLAWLGVLTYAFQIYFDFSGYSDMAIGLGRMFGFQLPENFNQPYTSRSITEFWRRWHMSLSQFFRDYVYIPLGGSHASLARTVVNLWAVFLLCGLWHGAKITFVIWGAYYGLWLTIERFWLSRVLERLPGAVANIYAFLVVLIGWVFFRAVDLPHALAFIGTMFDFSAMLHPVPAKYDLVIDFSFYPKQIFVITIAALLSFTPANVLENLRGLENNRVFAKAAVAGLLFSYSVMVLSTGTFNPFLYFQF